MIVDFQKSFLNWLTPEGSEGTFSADAYLHYQNNDWLLGSKVMACNVYGNKNLFKHPLYDFQPLFSKNESTIFRTYAADLKTNDNSFEPSLHFKSHSIIIKELQNFSDMDFTTEKNQSSNFQCKIETKDYVLQFPIRHLNINKSQNQFQVETGPVAFPFDASLSTGYIAFNKLHEFEILLSTNTNNKRVQKSIVENNCNIKLIYTT